MTFYAFQGSRSLGDHRKIRAEIILNWKMVDSGRCTGPLDPGLWRYLRTRNALNSLTRSIRLRDTKAYDISDEMVPVVHLCSSVMGAAKEAEGSGDGHRRNTESFAHHDLESTYYLFHPSGYDKNVTIQCYITCITW